MILLVALGLLMLLMAAGCAIYVAIGWVATVLFLAEGLSPGAMVQSIVDHQNSATLVAIPFFVVAARFMEVGGLAQALVKAGDHLLRALPARSALICILVSVLFSAVSGSATATALAMGLVMLPAMRQEGIPESSALGLVGASGTLGILIPPSVALMIYGQITETPIPDLFLGGLLPGVLIALLLAVFVAIRHRGVAPPTQPTSIDDSGSAAHAGWGLVLPVTIFGGIYSGVLTVVEAAVMASLEAIVLAVWVFKKCPPDKILALVVSSTRQSAGILVIVAMALAFGHWVAASGTAVSVTQQLLGLGLSDLTFLIVASLLFLVLGMFLEVVTVILVTVPLLYPVAVSLSVHPVHFAVVLIVNMAVATLTPPIGLNLFVLQQLSEFEFPEIVRAVLPYILVLFTALIVIISVPTLSTVLL